MPGRSRPAVAANSLAMPDPKPPGSPKPLPASYFDRPTLIVAREMLGCLLVHEHPDGSRLVGRVVETEAYTQEDPAFHGWGIVDRETGLVKPEGRGFDLFGKPGTAYVYLCYGTFWLLNVVTEREGVGGAVLIRALEPLEGIAEMHDRRGVERERELASGPGKLTIAFGVDRRHHGTMLTDPPLYFAEGDPVTDAAVTTRIGITRGVDLPWRFLERGNPHVSPGVPSDIAAARRRARQSGRVKGA
jgi:DNA-3-methyladenine glycosylase